MTINILPKKALLYTLSITGSLLLLNIISIIYRVTFLPPDALTHPYRRDGLEAFIFLLIQYFDFNTEVNFPTLYSTILLFLCAMLLMLIGWKEKRGNNKHVFWTAYSILFIFLSMDEFIQLHELLIRPLRNLLSTSGVLYFAWVIPYGILLVILLLLSLKFLSQLPRKIFKLFLIAGTIYVFGALIIELPEGWIAEKYGFDHKYFAILYTIEELFEMVGLNIFIYSLLSYFSFALKID